MDILQGLDKGFLDSLKLGDLLQVKAPDEIIKNAFLHDLEGNSIDCNIYHPKYGYKGFVTDKREHIITMWNPTIYTEPQTQKRVYCIKCLEITCLHPDGTLTNKDGIPVMFVDWILTNRTKLAESKNDFKEIYNREFQIKKLESTSEAHRYFRNELSDYVETLIKMYKSNRAFDGETRDGNLILLAERFINYINNSEYIDTTLPPQQNEWAEAIYKAHEPRREFIKALKDCSLPLEDIYDKAIEEAERRLQEYKNILDRNLNKYCLSRLEIIKEAENDLRKDNSNHDWLGDRKDRAKVIEFFSKFYGTNDDGLTIYKAIIDSFYAKRRYEYIRHLADAELEIPESSEDEGTTVQTPQAAPPPKLILFNSEETINKIFEALKVNFAGFETEFKEALDGKQLATPLLFPNNQNKFVEVFRRMKYNGFINSTYAQIQEWICINFQYNNKKLGIKKFSKESVKDILKGKTEVKKSERICNLEWLPYKSKNQLTTESETEKLKVIKR